MSSIAKGQKVAAREGSEWFAGVYNGHWLDYDEKSGKAIVKHKVARGNREYVNTIADEVVPLEDFKGELSSNAYYDNAVSYSY